MPYKSNNSLITLISSNFSVYQSCRTKDYVTTTKTTERVTVDMTWRRQQRHFQILQVRSILYDKGSFKYWNLDLQSL